MRRRRSGNSESFYESFSDLIFAVMAIFVLLFIILMTQVNPKGISVEEYEKVVAELEEREEQVEELQENLEEAEQEVEDANKNKGNVFMIIAWIGMRVMWKEGLK